MNLGVNQIKAFKKNNKLNSGLTGRFKKGQTAWNKGIKGLDIGGKETRFKKGHIPKNHRPVGSERVNVEGYVEVKIAEPNKWSYKHVEIWKEHCGEIPEGHAILFGDGDKTNFDINNLIMVSRQQLLVLNRKNLIQNNVDLTKTGVIIADLYRKINKRKRK